MRLIIYIFLISQLLNFIGVFAEKVNKNITRFNKVNWEKVEENKSNPLKKIIWKYYESDENYFEKKNKQSSTTDKKNSHSEKRNFKSSKISVFSITEIEPFLPLNNFLEYDTIQASVRWKSSFDGGVGGGTGQQNPSFVFDYGISDSSLISIYITGADDDLYNLVDGQKINYYWQSYALSLKKKLIDEEDFDFGLSLVSTLEYWRHASGSETAKSIYNQKDSTLGKDKFENLVGALSFPISKNLNENISALIVPGITFLPEKLGPKGIGKNSYGNNFYIGSGLVFDIAEDFNLLLSYTTPLGPGNNYFDSNLNYSRKPIYSFGLGWNVNPKIGIEGKITNSYGASPSTGILTIPSDDLPLYSATLTYRPYGEDTYLNTLNERDKLISKGGITVNNALLPKAGNSQINISSDSRGNLFGSYYYSLSNLFQLELLNIGRFNNLNFKGSKKSHLYSNYLDENNFNFRLGGKLLIFSPQKNDLYWLASRLSVGRNDDTNQGYLFTEFMNTFRLNNWLAFNVSPKYFFSGVESFGGIGFSSYINLSDNLMLIPEINTSIKNDSELNSTLAVRYSFSSEKSLDLYYSNAAGVQDIGHLLKDNENRFGIKLNFLY
ncbi:hypothetical protein HA152_06905 [Prochlorococcus marinus XMU1412]|uniref:hypothetical protein n=1 Tax=Prochlorococcus marinus TaxID=1219 RepID=UPI001ADAC995|nr:hypothetical protein [Prochlorococcus marinus]MBO8240430.1 hypothetical protein [Prochlorococcus marinus XMU1412]MBW3071666.1 hypothetical protein [Prochlorococcus marinus str. MU1412]